jgi:hypothetical protein
VPSGRNGASGRGKEALRALWTRPDAMACESSLDTVLHPVSLCDRWREVVVGDCAVTVERRAIRGAIAATGH